MSITYGIDSNSTDDRFLNASVEAAHAVSIALVPGKFLVDIIPMRGCLCTKTITYKHLTDPSIVRHIPDWFPGTGFKVLAKEAREKFEISVNGPLDYVKNAMKVSQQSSSASNCVSKPSVITSPARVFPSP
jgi:hypothetical protein